MQLDLIIGYVKIAFLFNISYFDGKLFTWLLRGYMQEFFVHIPQPQVVVTRGTRSNIILIKLRFTKSNKL